MTSRRASPLHKGNLRKNKKTKFQRSAGALLHRPRYNLFASVGDSCNVTPVGWPFTCYKKSTCFCDSAGHGVGLPMKQTLPMSTCLYPVQKLDCLVAFRRHVMERSHRYVDRTRLLLICFMLIYKNKTELMTTRSSFVI